jgi:hypothetical protein
MYLLIPSHECENVQICEQVVLLLYATTAGSSGPALINCHTLSPTDTGTLHGRGQHRAMRLQKSISQAWYGCMQWLQDLVGCNSPIKYLAPRGIVEAAYAASKQQHRQTKESGPDARCSERDDYAE